MELVDMNSLGLFDFFLILSVQVGFTLYYDCSLPSCFLSFASHNSEVVRCLS